MPTVIDDVTLGSATITGQSIGAALLSTGFNGMSSLILSNQRVIATCFQQGFDGILGIGPVDLTEGTTSSGGTVPTVTDNLMSQGTISQDLVGVSFVPTTVADAVQNGELDFGAVDEGKFTGPISFVPITTTSPANKFYGIDQSITYVNLSCMLASFSNCSCATVYIWTGMDLLILASLAVLQASSTQVWF